MLTRLIVPGFSGGHHHHPPCFVHPRLGAPSPDSLTHFQWDYRRNAPSGHRKRPPGGFGNDRCSLNWCKSIITKGNYNQLWGEKASVL